ncbi:MAG: hypothetical protein ACKO0W_09510 [Planctomycetota bacterium]
MSSPDQNSPPSAGFGALEGSSLAGATALDARVVERCAGCAERPRGSAGGCRCATPRFAPYCTRCVKTVPGAPCPHCLEVARANGASLGREIDGLLAKHGGRAGAAAAAARLESRVATLLGEFSIDAVAPALPAWAEPLVDAKTPAERSRAEAAALSDLRLEQAAVRLAIDGLGYAGRPTEEKLRRIVDESRGQSALLASFDGLAAGHEQVGAVRAAASGLASGLATAETLISSVKTRNLDRLSEAASRRDRALAACGKLFKAR